ncbi:HIT family protein [Campylobacter canadensis]|uniref:HIT family protein n=1 Tax=Campylobacter canadensis TaxID=449520 RepID=A0ABS7WS32_9BACT|nr:HIT family protein [Campylobacter canadensis]MBZ7987565.1 HIT family protein [Campylobacter canadensis]MBZ7994910.1 HIT family protein [Campylobacter canadensis]MBZ7996703.1 HIT family protein [Campylobacter canadensis]MBZ7998679.1 HIT family protein [Campylobacter canadensis]MBZ8000327.1 HIT family protein [Campylobacter canadensis]
MNIYEDNFCYIKLNDSNIPWLIIYAKEKQKELSDNIQVSKHIFNLAIFIEKEMIDFFKPTKINHASFANYLTQAHWHIMARFSDDGFYPECMWGKKQSDILKDYTKNIDEFCNILKEKLKTFSQTSPQ